MAINSLYGQPVDPAQVQVQLTRSEFEGDQTVMVFPFLKISKKSPEVTGQEIGEYLVANVAEVSKFNVVKGFLNLVIDNKFWIDRLNEAIPDDHFGFLPVTDQSELVMIEYSSPNTNKPASGSYPQQPAWIFPG